jgi:hypothetical protein
MSQTEPRYSISFGSDVDRDGVYLELARLEPGASFPVIEFFRSDEDGRITITAEGESIPADWFNQLLDQAKIDLLRRPLTGQMVTVSNREHR